MALPNFVKQVLAGERPEIGLTFYRGGQYAIRHKMVQGAVWVPKLQLWCTDWGKVWGCGQGHTPLWPNASLQNNRCDCGNTLLHVLCRWLRVTGPNLNGNGDAKLGLDDEDKATNKAECGCAKGCACVTSRHHMYLTRFSDKLQNQQPLNCRIALCHGLYNHAPSGIVHTITQGLVYNCA